MKKVLIFGGGTGLSCVLSGLKLFPVEVTSVIAVSDDGSSTGVLKEELDIPAVGDLGKVLLSMANVDEDFVQLLRYRFKKDGTLYNHPVRNILLAALIDLKGDLTEASRYMCKLLNIKGEVLPLTGEKVDLIGHGETDTYVGECEVSQNIKNIRNLTYDHPIKVTQEVIDKMHEADLIILSPGSLYTSIIPHLIAPSVKEALHQISAPIMYISNLVCQPGETDDYTVSDHVKALNQYLGDRKVDIVLANNGHIDPEIIDVYRVKEQKSVVRLDAEELERLGAKLIVDDVVHIDNGSIRHNELKTAYLVFSYLMDA
ncbi:MAG: YvcK family protein [Firmicutes bacterium]|nr:YvcK family protein [Bacillota bacterium]